VRSCPLERNYKIVFWSPCILGSLPWLNWEPPGRSSPAGTSRLHRWRSCRRCRLRWGILWPQLIRCDWIKAKM
jgi:hypothetical protein